MAQMSDYCEIVFNAALIFVILIFVSTKINITNVHVYINLKSMTSNTHEKVVFQKTQKFHASEKE